MTCIVYRQVKDVPLSSRIIQKLVQTLLLSFPQSKRGSLNVHLVGLDRMRTLNRTMRGVDRPTDVLSFAITKDQNTRKTERDLGDIFLCVPYLASQARRFGVSVREECARMLIHGVLHIGGFDHTTKKEADRMFFLQEKLLRKLHL